MLTAEVTVNHQITKFQAKLRLEIFFFFFFFFFNLINGAGNKVRSVLFQFCLILFYLFIFFPLTTLPGLITMNICSI